MNVSKTYTDFLNKIAITIPDQFIDVKSGNSHQVSAKIQEQIEYHANNNTLQHLIFSALHDFMKPKSSNYQTNLILEELSTIKNLLQRENSPSIQKTKRQFTASESGSSLDLEEVENVLEYFGG